MVMLPNARPKGEGYIRRLQHVGVIQRQVVGNNHAAVIDSGRDRTRKLEVAPSTLAVDKRGHVAADSVRRTVQQHKCSRFLVPSWLARPASKFLAYPDRKFRELTVRPHQAGMPKLLPRGAKPAMK